MTRPTPVPSPLGEPRSYCVVKIVGHSSERPTYFVSVGVPLPVSKRAQGLKSSGPWSDTTVGTIGHRFGRPVTRTAKSRARKGLQSYPPCVPSTTGVPSVSRMVVPETGTLCPGPSTFIHWLSRLRGYVSSSKGSTPGTSLFWFVLLGSTRPCRQVGLSRRCKVL